MFVFFIAVVFSNTRKILLSVAVYNGDNTEMKYCGVVPVIVTRGRWRGDST